MKYIDEYRNEAAIKKCLSQIEKICSRPWKIMEVCGGQTHSIVKYRLQQLLPKGIELIHGPGCPVCVTPLELIDRAIDIATKSGVIFCTFGDMLRVPGSKSSLMAAKGEGADIRILYSPLDAVALAKSHRDKEVVFFAVGFETTAPATAMSVAHAAAEGVKNFSLVVSHFLVPPALEALLPVEGSVVQGLLAAGHVCTIMGYEEYLPLAKKYRLPIVVTGFEPLDILEGIYLCIKQLEEGRCEVENQYTRSVAKEGNREALKMVEELFTPVDRQWRGIGTIANSGYGLREKYRDFDAEKRFECVDCKTIESTPCIAAEILQGRKKPKQCPAYGVECTPKRPLGAPMVSSEGACAAYYRYEGAAR